MCEDQGSDTLYWEEGPARATIMFPFDMRLVQGAAEKAAKNLEVFRDECQELSILFDIISVGQKLWLDKYKSVLEQNSNNAITFGSTFPDHPQSRGRSTISATSVKRLLELLKPEGEYEDLVAKTVVIFIYQLWEKKYRKQIAHSLSIEPMKMVECDLMGDIREIRHAIVHKHSVLKQKTVDKLKMLPHIWPIEAGKLLVTSSMIHALMEQFNAIRIKVGTPHDVVR